MQPREVIKQKLAQLGIEYNECVHEPVLSMDECAQIAARLGITPCKNLLLNDRQGNFYLVMLSPDKRLAVKTVAQKIGCSRLSFVNGPKLYELIGATPGCVSPLGLIFDGRNLVRLLIDSDLLKFDFMVCHPCDNTCSIKIKLTDFFNKYLPSINHSDFTVLDLD